MLAVALQEAGGGQGGEIAHRSPWYTVGMAPWRFVVLHLLLWAAAVLVMAALWAPDGEEHIAAQVDARPITTIK